MQRARQLWGMQRPFLAALLATSALFLACDDGITDADRVVIDFATAADTLFKHASIQLTPTVTNDGVVINRAVAWSSSDTLIARVNAAGVVTGVGRGSAVVTASIGAARALKTIVVDSLLEVRVAPFSPLLIAGDSVRLGATGVGEMRTVELRSDLTWISSDTSVATVGANGTVVARRPGTITVTARQHDSSGTTSVGVLPGAINRQAACAAAGTLHHGSKATATWRAADGPHILIDSVIVSQLTIEPGSIVCGLPGSSIVLRGVGGLPARLEANGTADKPIRFTAADPAREWRGIDGNAGSSATIAHALIEHAELIMGWAGPVSIQDSRLRHADLLYCDQTFPSSVTIRRTVIDSAIVCLTTGIFEDNVIRGGSLSVTQNRSGSPLTINGGRIEDSPGVAFTMERSASFRDPYVVSTRPLRIIRSRGYPVDISLEGFVQIWPTRESQDSLLGNVKDTLSLWGNAETVTRPLYLRRDLPWKVQTHGSYGPAGVLIGALTIEPGASLTADRLVANGSVVALGTVASPITIATATCDWCGLFLTGTASSALTNVIFAGPVISAIEQHRVTLQGITSSGRIELGSAGSSLTDSKVHGVPAGKAGVGLAAILIRASDVQVLRCDVRDNGGDGIRVTSPVTGNVRIHDCNLENNDGVGVNNRSGFMVDARRNWWGDPAGPLGPMGGGVSGNVDTSAFLRAPFAMENPPAAIVRVRVD